ncbi:hypothetical protein [Bradyrhizobium canariense]|uniref:DUF4412 domain-containing protein n=1 Tax=Bradyrhizobium canariense TaxID=255045 RepID=A0A1H1YIG8_9BRAD|nr:hypothetical protein [Bradyrhizobium canariense]SDT20826.1 hypothetical protein SAMN05444158_4814 [Bradyrhizobium canariense]
MTKGPMIVLLSNRSWLSLLAVVGFLLCGRVSAQAQQFSADLVTLKDDGALAPAGRLRVSSDKVRIETPELADGFFVIDGAKPAAFFVRPAARQFMDARQSSRLTRMFVQVDPDDPCRQWEAMAKVAGVADQGSNQGNWRCERIGEETIDGNGTIAYRAVLAPNRELFGWIDPARKFPLRIKTEDGAVIAAQNVRDEPQPAQMFEIPSGFRKFDPEALIQRIKQSDVWVANGKDSQNPHP